MANRENRWFYGANRESLSWKFSQLSCSISARCLHLSQFIVAVLSSSWFSMAIFCISIYVNAMAWWSLFFSLVETMFHAKQFFHRSRAWQSTINETIKWDKKKFYSFYVGTYQIVHTPVTNCPRPGSKLSNARYQMVNSSVPNGPQPDTKWSTARY